ncbi:hypothetical protein G4B88_010118 [Cannabis sativa]|uniref:Retrotransposon Copia-like N-terminal domain-containing protein n=1 Tax=Cannabis sativa TaxID=3483 RepID=A0A7J6GJ96_CANSA|nr:hypothetical protein G4B88_010118 [Cannabis sativa]
METPTSTEKSSTNEPAVTMTALPSEPVIPVPNTISSPFQSLAPLTIKLDRTNYPYWKSQVLPTLRAYDLEGYILGTKLCPPQFVDNTIGGSVPASSYDDSTPRLTTDTPHCSTSPAPNPSSPSSGSCTPL